MKNKFDASDPKGPPHIPDDKDKNGDPGDDSNNGWSSWPLSARIVASVFVALWLLGGAMILIEHLMR